MATRRLLNDMADSLTLATRYPPDEYPDDLPITYEEHKADIQSLWQSVRPRLKRDLEKAEVLNFQLKAMFAAYDAGDKTLGRKIAWDIYNAKPEKLR